MKDLFIVGDVHGCFYTLQELLKKWRPETEQLIFVGDLIDNGNHIPQTVALILQLKEKYPDTIILKGNHEKLFHDHVLGDFNEDWMQKAGESTFAQYLLADRRIEPDALYFKQLPLCFKNRHVLISHAGITDTAHPFDEDNPKGVLYQRYGIKRTSQLQVYGHTPQDCVIFDADTHSVCIDTGAYKCNKLSGILIRKDKIVELREEITHYNDRPEQMNDGIKIAANL